MSYDISIVISSIRPNLLLNLYNGIDFKGNWELIIVGPYDIPQELLDDLEECEKKLRESRGKITPQEILYDLYKKKRKWILQLQ